jgi:hypothetical protein
MRRFFSFVHHGHSESGSDPQDATTEEREFELVDYLKQDKNTTTKASNKFASPLDVATDRIGAGNHLIAKL